MTRGGLQSASMQSLYILSPLSQDVNKFTEAFGQARQRNCSEAFYGGSRKFKTQMLSVFSGWNERRGPRTCRYVCRIYNSNAPIRNRYRVLDAVHVYFCTLETTQPHHNVTLNSIQLRACQLCVCLASYVSTGRPGVTLMGVQ